MFFIIYTQNIKAFPHCLYTQYLLLFVELSCSFIFNISLLTFYKIGNLTCFKYISPFQQPYINTEVPWLMWNQADNLEDNMLNGIDPFQYTEVGSSKGSIIE